MEATQQLELKQYWQERIADDRFNALLEIHDTLNKGNHDVVLFALNEYIEEMASDDFHALINRLVILMQHVIKWKEQPQKRTVSWLESIENQQLEIAYLMERRPSFTRAKVEREWPKAFERARRSASREMFKDAKRLKCDPPTWVELFEVEYQDQDIPPYFPQ